MKIKRLGKVLVIIAASFLLFLIIAILSLNSFLKSDQFKKIVTGRIETILNMPVEIGHFRVNVLSGVQIDNFNIKNPQGFPEGYSLKTESIVLKYNLYDLLRRNFNIEEIEVVHPDIHLLQKADGTWNFPLTSSETTSTANRKIIPLLADSIQIIEGNLTYTKLEGGRTLSIQNFTLRAKIHGINSFPNGNLNLSIDKIDYPRVPLIEDIKCNIKTSKDMAYLDSGSLHLSGGVIAIKGDTTVPVEEKNAEYTANISVKDIDLQTLASQFLPETEKSTERDIRYRYYDKRTRT